MEVQLFGGSLQHSHRLDTADCQTELRYQRASVAAFKSYSPATSHILS
jgi:hypothetical protein